MNDLLQKVKKFWDGLTGKTDVEVRQLMEEWAKLMETFAQKLEQVEGGYDFVRQKAEEVATQNLRLKKWLTVSLIISGITVLLDVVLLVLKWR
jgi:ABC-type maltose transport system permease subunit